MTVAKCVDPVTGSDTTAPAAVLIVSTFPLNESTVPRTSEGFIAADVSSAITADDESATATAAMDIKRMTFACCEFEIFSAATVRQFRQSVKS
jgi:hypothetical protein